MTASMVVAREMAAWRAYKNYVLDRVRGLPRSNRTKNIEFKGNAESARLFTEWQVTHRERWGLA